MPKRLLNFEKNDEYISFILFYLFFPFFDRRMFVNRGILFFFFLEQFPFLNL